MAESAIYAIPAGRQEGLPRECRTMAIVDISTASGGTPVANIIWIGNVTVYR